MDKEKTKNATSESATSTSLWSRFVSAASGRRSLRISIFATLFITMLILNLAPALAYYQSHNLSEIRHIDVDLDMNDYNITNINRVGVGTANPLSKLSVGGNGNANYAIAGYGIVGVYGNGSTMGGYFYDGNDFSRTYLAYGSYGIYSMTGSMNYLAGNLGIGTASPGEKLEVNGNINSTGGDICISGGNCLSTRGAGTVDGSGAANNITKWSDSDTLTTTPIYETGGNVGIGTSSPVQKLEVKGGTIQGNYSGSGSFVSGAGVFGSGTYGVYGKYDNTNYGYLGSSSYGVYAHGSPALRAEYDSDTLAILGGSTYGLVAYYDADTMGSIGESTRGVYGQYDNNNFGVLGRANQGVYGKGTAAAGYFEGNVTVTGNVTVGTGTVFIDGTNSRVGVGTATPNYDLQIHSDGSTNSYLQFTNGATGSGVSDGVFFGINIAGNAFLFNQESGKSLSIGTSGGEKMLVKSDGDVAIDTDTLYVETAGRNVGIGTASPDQKLKVDGNVNVTGNITVGTETVFIDGTNSRIGIGTSNPLADVHIGRGSYIGTSSAKLLISDPTSSAIEINNGSSTGRAMMYLTSSTNLFTIASTGDMWFSPGFGARMMINHSNGNVGIGTLYPAAKLHVQGGTIIGNASGSGAVTSNTGVYGTGSTYGVYGYYSSNTFGYLGGSGVGVNGSGSSYGVYGWGGTYGVFGRGTEFGVRGCDDDACLSNYGYLGAGTTGVYGRGQTWGGYFIGDGYFSGNVGIGTTSPLSKLSVGGSGDANYTIYGELNSTTYGALGYKYSLYGSDYGVGVYGAGDNQGLRGCYSGDCGNNYGFIGSNGYGIYATGTSYAALFGGNVKVIGDMEITGNLTVDNYGCGTYVVANVCPVGNANGPRCYDVPVGGFCEGNTECGTSNSLDNCGTYDWYFRTG